jgi:hypothetical protein
MKKEDKNFSHYSQVLKERAAFNKLKEKPK